MILASQCDIIINNQLANGIAAVTHHWNTICKRTINNVTGFTSCKMNHTDILDYQSRVYDVAQVLHQLLTPYQQFGKNYLINTINKNKMIDKIDSHLCVLMNEFSWCLATDESQKRRETATRRKQHLTPPQTAKPTKKQQTTAKAAC